MRNQIMHLIKGELIGKKIKIISLNNTKINGTIIDETKHTITIKTQTTQKQTIKNTENKNIMTPKSERIKIKKIIKNKQNKFQFEIAQKKIIITGDKLIGSPEDRIKIKTK